MVATAQQRTPRLLEPGCGALGVDDWLDLPDTPDRYELYRGMLVMAPPPDTTHQSAAGLLYAALQAVALT